jgi:hypothetical protein
MVHANTVMGRMPTLIKTFPCCRAGLIGSNPVLTTNKIKYVQNKKSAN